MKNVIKTIKTLKIVWPNYSLPDSMCRILDRLEDDLVSYWEPYWDYDKEKIGIRFASEEGAIEALPGCVVTVEDGYAVRMRKNLKDENTPTTRIDEKKRTVAYIYDPGVLRDLRALSESGHRVVFDEDRLLVSNKYDMVDVAGGWVVENPVTGIVRAEHGAVDPDDIAKELGGELIGELV